MKDSRPEHEAKAIYGALGSALVVAAVLVGVAVVRWLQGYWG